MPSVTAGNGTITYSFEDTIRLLFVSYSGENSLGCKYDLVETRPRLAYSDDSYVKRLDYETRRDQISGTLTQLLINHSSQSFFVPGPKTVA